MLGEDTDCPQDSLKFILHERHHKFLGGLFTFDAKGNTVASVIYDRFYEGLTNIDGLLVRDEFKARIYADYFLGSQRFVFSKGQIEKLEEITHPFWPQHSPYG